jgi:sortase B
MNTKAVKALTAVCLAIAVIAALLLAAYLHDAHEEENNFSTIRPPIKDVTDMTLRSDLKEPADHYPEQWNELKAMNPDFVFWLKVPGTKVDYPVMQRAGSPEYYLHRDFEGKESASGTPFLSAACDIEKPSQNLVVFGHHMRSGQMFATLTRLTDRSFYDKHYKIQLLTKRGLEEYRIISVFRTQVYTGNPDEFRYFSKSDFTGTEDFAAFMAEVTARQYYDTGITASLGDRLITLSTCEYTSRNGRLVVIGVLADHEGG